MQICDRISDRYVIHEQSQNDDANHFESVYGNGVKMKEVL